MSEKPMKIGKRQRCWLAKMAHVGAAQVIMNDVTKSLVAKGLAASLHPDSFIYVTPAGYRALADELDAGRVDCKPVLKARKP
jgi:hypothetical protein